LVLCTVDRSGAPEVHTEQKDPAIEFPELAQRAAATIGPLGVLHGRQFVCVPTERYERSRHHAAPGIRHPVHHLRKHTETRID
jgi:hypothetical protein